MTGFCLVYTNFAADKSHHANQIINNLKNDNMKRFTLLLLLFLYCLIHVSAQTAKAIYCADNTTLYFVYNNTTYRVRGTYDGHTITAVYTNLEYTDINNKRKWYEHSSSITTVQFESSFSAVRPYDLSSWFRDMTNLTTVNGIENLNTSMCTDMAQMFEGCESLTSLDVSGFNTSNVTSMHQMFLDCKKLTSLDVSGWNTSKLTTMHNLFGNCKKLTSLDVSRWDTGNVTRMSSVFWGCESLTTPPDVSRWNTSKVTDMYGLFGGCRGLTTPPDVSRWNTGKVTNMQAMFFSCRGLTTPPDVSGWDTGKVIRMDQMFASCDNLITPPDVSGWDTGNVTNMSAMFDFCHNLTTPPDVSGWDTGNVTDMKYMFRSNESFTTPPDVSGWDTGNVTNMKAMFHNCRKMRSLTFGKNFSMDKVTDSSDMIGTCNSLRYIDFYASDDTDAITSVERTEWEAMFHGVPQTTVIYLPHGSREVTDVANVVYSYNGDAADLRCPNYYSEDKVDIEFPRDFKTNKAEYSRPTMASTYGTVVLPYDFTTNSDIQAYTLDEEYPKYMYFKDTQTVPAHTPFAFKKLGRPEFIMEDGNNNFGITVRATNTTSAEESGTPYAANTNLGGWTTKGYYVNETVSDYADTYYIAGDKFYLADGALTLYPHRVTFHGTWEMGSPEQDSNGAKYYGIEAPERQVTNAIKAADMRQTEREAQDIYDELGRRQDSLRHGLNIVRMANGSVRKVIRK